jgi:hypothetical protein
MSKERVKQFILANGIDVVLQSIIEIVDDSVDLSDVVHLWKFRFLDSLEDAYDSYMTRVENDETSTA